MTSLLIPFIVAAVVFELVVGVRLVLLARQTRGLAERLWGWAWLLDALSQGGAALSSELLSGTPAYVLGVAMAGVGSASLSLLAVGIWQVFRAEERWMAWLIGAGLVLLTVTFTALALSGGIVSTDGTRPPMTWINRVLGCVLLAWGAIECWLAYLASAKQLRLGLVEPLRVVRFQLWGASAVFLLTFLLLLIARDVVGLPNTLVRTLQPILAFLSVVGMWLTYFPPRWMQRRFGRGA